MPTPTLHYLCGECAEVQNTSNSSTLDDEGLADTRRNLIKYGPLHKTTPGTVAGEGSYRQCTICGCDTLCGVVAYTTAPTTRNYLAEVAALDRQAFSYYQTLRALVAAAATEGRATYLPAGARGNATALVHIDGVEVGQASTCAHWCTPAPGRGVYSEVALIPNF